MVWRTARGLHDALAGRVLCRSEFRVPRWATLDLAGREVDEVVARGKHLLTRISGGLTIHTHLRMEGSYRIFPADRPTPNGHRVRLVLANAAWQAVGFQLGAVDVLDTAAEARVVGHLGPDLLGEDWDAEEARRRLLSASDRPIGEALLDQRNLAGIGNLYKAEVLFLRGVWPWRPTSEVDDLGRLVGLAQRLLVANRSDIDQVTTGDRRPGRRNWVYRRAGRPCRRCGTTVGAAGQGDPSQERVTFWCPSCQPEHG